MSIYDFSVISAKGEKISLEKYKGKVLLIVNTASKCGFTPQYEELEKLYEDLGNEKFEILGFPCNQFAKQEPGNNDEIMQFCKLNYGVTFSIMAKIDVNGENAHPLFKYLKEQSKGILNKNIKWNFTKFLIDSKGNVVDRFAPVTAPKNIKKDIEALIKNA